MAESFFSSLKEELIHRQSWATRAQARRAIVDYIEVFYNRRRFLAGISLPGRVRSPKDPPPGGLAA